MTGKTQTVYRSKNNKVTTGLSYKILQLIEERGSVTLNEVYNDLDSKSHYIATRFEDLLKKDFIFRINKRFYFSPNAVLIITKQLSRFCDNGERSERLDDTKIEKIKSVISGDLKSRKIILQELKDEGITKHQIYKQLDKMVEAGEIKKYKFDMLDQRKVGYCLSMEVVS